MMPPAALPGDKWVGRIMDTHEIIGQSSPDIKWKFSSGYGMSCPDTMFGDLFKRLTPGMAGGTP